MKFRFMPDIQVPGPAAIKDTIGNRRMFRTLKPIKSDSAETKHPDQPFHQADHTNATLVSSLVHEDDGFGDWHEPVIDIDLPCMLIPSTQPGHFHLYINKGMPFDTMVEMLEAMAKAGVVQYGFVEHTKRRGRAMVRYPGVTKHNEQARIDGDL